MAIIIGKKSISSATFKTSFTTPVTLLAAPTAGTVNVIFSISQYFNYVAPAYTVVSYGTLYTVSQNLLYIGTLATGYTYTESYHELPIPFAANNQSGNLASIQFPLILTGALMFQTDANPATGNGTLDFLIPYENKVLTTL